MQRVLERFQSAGVKLGHYDPRPEEPSPPEHGDNGAGPAA
jgi:hypothetical protein